MVDVDFLTAALAEAGGADVYIQAANNETGLLQPLPILAPIIHAQGGVLIADIAQMVGRMPCDFATLDADVLVLSAHKFGGPKGVGALVFRDSRLRLTQAFIQGGGQERGLRAGTENLLGIVGMGAAAACVMQEVQEAAAHMARLRDLFETGLKNLVPDAVIFGEIAPRLPNTSCFALPFIKADQALIRLDLAGIALSSGSACSSGKVRASAVLAAMGAAPGLRGSALRLSLGRTTEESEIQTCLQEINTFSLRR